MGEQPWSHNVATVRLSHRYGGQTLTNVFHLGCAEGFVAPAAVAAVSVAIMSAWSVGHPIGHSPLSAEQGAGVVLAGSHAYFRQIDGLMGLGIDGFGVESVYAPPDPPLPANVTVAVGADCQFGGHSGRGWQFFPWLRRSALELGYPDRLSSSSRANIVTGYQGVAAAVSEVGGPFGIELAIFHRGSRYDPDTTAVRWWDPVAAFRVRSAGLAEIRVRLPAHKRRRTFGVDR